MGTRRTARSWNRAFSAIAAAVILGLAGVLAAGSTAAPDVIQGGPKFVARYQASFEATWHRSSPVELPDPNHTFRCSGEDASGSLTSSVTSSGKPFVVRIGKEPGGSWLSLSFQPPNGDHKAVVSSNRTAQEWLMRYSGHQCVRYDIPEPGCGPHTFPTMVVPLDSVTGRLGSGINPVYHVQVSWPLEPGTAVGCGDGVVLPPDYDYGWRGAVFRIRPLYRCALKKPRGCKLTLGRDRTYVYNHTEGTQTETSTVHVKWSLTLTGAGR